MQSLVSNKAHVLLNKPSCVAQHGGTEDPLDAPGQPHRKQFNPTHENEIHLCNHHYYASNIPH